METRLYQEIILVLRDQSDLIYVNSSRDCWNFQLLFCQISGSFKREINVNDLFVNSIKLEILQSI
jgi:hypothetical protein